MRQLHVPCVNVLGESTLPGIPNLAPDNALVSNAAVNHMLDRGLRQFAFCGFRGLRFSERRKSAFCDVLSARGYPVSVFEDGEPERTIGLVAFEQKWLQDLDRMESWLRELPKPVGLMACNDVRAYQVSNACREVGLNVPDEISIIGVDNDPTLCELATPPLTSIDPNPAKVGYEAAALLEQMIESGGAAPDDVWIEPTGIISRHRATCWRSPIAMSSRPCAASATGPAKDSRSKTSSPLRPSRGARSIAGLRSLSAARSAMRSHGCELKG